MTRRPQRLVIPLFKELPSDVHGCPRELRRARDSPASAQHAGSAKASFPVKEKSSGTAGAARTTYSFGGGIVIPDLETSKVMVCAV